MSIRRLTWFSILVLLVAAATSWPARAQAPSRAWALIIGVDQYDSSDITPLNFAEADARSVATALVQAGGFARERVFVLTSRGKGRSRATRANIVDWLVRLRSNIRPQDTFVIFFSGHGISIDKRSYLVTVDTITDPVENLELSSLKMETLRALLQKIQARRMLIAVDACRNDPRAGKGSVDNRLTSALARDLVLRRTKAAKGEVQVLATLYACKVGERSYEWAEKGQGFFSYFFVQGLRGGARDASGKVTLTSLINYLENRVAAETRLWKGAQAQTPWAEVAGTGAGRWVLAGPAGDAGVPPESTSQPSDPSQPAAPEEATLMQRAQEAFKAGRFGEPAGDNALELARKALEVDPESGAARELENRAAAAYENLAILALSQQDSERALQIYKRLLAFFPDRTAYAQKVAELEVPPLPDVAGLWRDYKGNPYTLKADHTVFWEGGGYSGTGTWRWADEKARRLVIEFKIGITFDLVVSRDGRRAEGTSINSSNNAPMTLTRY